MFSWMYMLWEPLNDHLINEVYWLQTHNPLLRLHQYVHICYQVGHEFKNYPFGDDKLKWLMRE